MKFKSENIATSVNILANDHFVAIPYDCSSVTANADGIIKAGSLIPANDATAKGVLLTDVKKEDNPNGTIVIHGFIEESKLPEAPATEAKTALSQVLFI